MPDAALPSWPMLEGATAYLDEPRAGEKLFAEAFLLSGWLWAPERDPAACLVRAWVNGACVGETRLLFVRPDVCAAMQLPADTPTGFRILARAAGPAETAELTVTAEWPGENLASKMATAEVTLVSAQLETRPYGDVVHPEQEEVLPRDRIYGSGPPVETPGGETLSLLEQHLPAGGSVLDVGCGAGAYGPALLAAGHAWTGLEVTPDCWARLERRGLPFRKVEGAHLPCADGEFDDAICVEVLEHIAAPEVFLGEIARSIRRRALFSVPNLEVIPYFSAWQVVPWHLLEADHKNFFTRASLRALLQRHFRTVEVTSYAPHPLRMPEGIPVHLHLFAVAEK